MHADKAIIKDDRLGVKGILKDSNRRPATSLTEVSKETLFLSGTLMNIILKRTIVPQVKHSRKLDISPREFHVLELSLSGLLKQEIADKLFISPKT
jgi:DNA-binding NarL/FixJ family response regulator